MIKWMLGFVLLAIIASIASFVFAIPAAGTVAIICVVLAFLLLFGRIFEKTASA